MELKPKRTAPNFASYPLYREREPQRVVAAAARFANATRSLLPTHDKGRNRK